MRAVADQFVETRAAAGVQRIYGIIGDSLNGLTDLCEVGKVSSALGTILVRAGGG